VKASLKLWHHACDLVLLADSGVQPNRIVLAKRWKCTIRNVSAVLARAHALYGIEVESQRRDDGTHGYNLVTAGLIDLSQLKRTARSAKRKRKA
jgi:hypothetical protein